MKLEVKNLHKSFGETEVLHGISFSVESGRALGLLGRNGAGKTTTIRILMQVFGANEGTVLMDGVPFSPKKIGIDVYKRQAWITMLARLYMVD